MTPSNAPEDFVDFYQVLEVDRESTTTHLRRRINELYSESMSNRDHRNPNKRRRYEALCELLPYCRIVLLDPDKRARYDRYVLDVEAGKSDLPSFDSVMEEVAGSVGPELSSGEKVGLLGVEGDDDLLLNTAEEPAPVPAKGRRAADRRTPEPAPAPKIAPAPRPARSVSDSTPVAPAEETVSMSGKRISRSASDSLMGSLMSVIAFFVVFVIVSTLAAKSPHRWEWAIIPAAIIGVIVWVATHRRTPGNRV